MYFLNLAYSGMLRRWFTTTLSLFATTVLLTSAVSLAVWAYWLGWKPDNLKAKHTVAVFVDSADDSVFEKAFEQVLQLSGVYTAEKIGVAQFGDYLSKHFPDLWQSVQGMGADVIPRMLTVTLDSQISPEGRMEVIQRISSIKDVGRVDDESASMAKAETSINWLSMGGMALSMGLWLALLIVALSHYQGILYRELQEVQLMRSLGATKFTILLPWILEAICISAVATVFSLLSLLVGKSYLVKTFNQFFGAIGYTPIALHSQYFFQGAIIIFVAACLAHILGSFIALARGNIA